MKWRIVMTGMVFMMGSFVANAVDVFGLSEIEARQIMNKYRKSLEALDANFQRTLAKHPFESSSVKIPDTPDVKAMKKQKSALIKRIKKENGFLYTNFETIAYPGQDKLELHSTLEIIDKKHPERLRFVKNELSSAKPRTATKHQADVIESMIKYGDIQTEIMMTPGIGNKESPCPVYHCVMGFSHPRLKPYLKEFNEAAVKQKSLILSTIKSDPSSERRGAAIFLVGHFQNPREIITTLMPYINDSDRLVRNNSMRVIGETVEKSKITDFDISTIHQNLESPYITDRNKALFVLYEVSKSKNNHALILKRDGAALLELLRLEQPNNHKYAYLILKEISGIDLGSTNVAGWSKWVDSALSAVA